MPDRRPKPVFMKKALLLSLSSGILYLSVTSFSNGIAQHGHNRTGAQNSLANCSGAGCHANANTSFTLTMSVFDLQTQSTTTEYIPGQVYLIDISASSTYFQEYGFQFAATDSNGAGVGNFVPTSGLQSNPLSGLELIEHTDPIPAINNDLEKQFLWKAPQGGYGPLNLYVTVLGANGDNFATGDRSENRMIILTEGTLNVNDVDQRLDVSAFPNPFTNQFSLNLEKLPNSSLNIQVLNLQGQQVFHTSAVAPSSDKLIIDAASWAPGMYLVRLVADNITQTIPVKKL